MELAHKVAELQNREPVQVILHTDITDVNTVYFQTLMDMVMDKYEALLSKYQRCSIAIENTMIMKNAKGIATFTNAIDNTYRVYRAVLDRTVRKNRFGITIDTCHAELNNKLLDILRPFNPTIPKDSLGKIFEQAGKACKVIHLADSKGLGFGYLEHGSGFNKSPESQERLERYLNLISIHCPESYVVLEITEEDYDGRPDMLRSLRYVREFLARQ